MSPARTSKLTRIVFQIHLWGGTRAWDLRRAHRRNGKRAGVPMRKSFSGSRLRQGWPQPKRRLGWTTFALVSRRTTLNLHPWSLGSTLGRR